MHKSSQLVKYFHFYTKIRVFFLRNASGRNKRFKESQRVSRETIAIPIE